MRLEVGLLINNIENLAEVSVARGCGFAALAIVTLMIGLSDQMHLSCKAGGTLTLGACLILAIRGLTAPSTPYKHTEVWVMLDTADRPQPAVAQRIIGKALRDAYLRFALHAAVLSAALLCLSVVLQMLGGRAG